MELLTMLTKAVCLLSLAVTFLCMGCGARFTALRGVNDDNIGFHQHRGAPSGNALIDVDAGLLDTVLYSKKLNGGIGAQVVGVTNAIMVPTFNERIYFLNPDNGKERTSVLTKSTVGSAVAIAHELMYYAQEAGGDLLTCLNVATGKTIWRLKITDPLAAPIVDGDELFITSRTGFVYRINRLQGEVIWQYDAGAQCYAAPAVDCSRVYLGTSKGEILCLSRKTGDLLWTFESSMAIFAQPLIERYLFCGSGDGRLYALDVATGKQVWSFVTPSPIHTTPVITGGRLVFGSDDQNLFCLDPGSGNVLWRFETDGIVQSSPIVVGKTFICANSAGSLYQLDFDGKLLKSFKVKGSVTAPVSFVNGKLFVVTRQRMLYCFGFAAANRQSN
jgi:outer membrane protein assembly factor BamB